MPLLWLSLAFLVGIVVAARCSLPAPFWLLWAGSALLALLLIRWLKNIAGRAARSFPSLPLIYPLAALVFCLGAARYQVALPDLDDPDFIAAYNDSGDPVMIQGLLVAPPDRRDSYTNLRLRVLQIELPGGLPPQPVSGLLLAKVPPGEDWRYGDRVLLHGDLQTPPQDEDFSYRDYLARQDVYAYVPVARAELLARGQGNPLLAGVYAYKERALGTVYRLWPDPEASLLAGILLGVESGIPAPVQQAFKDTGTSHIIAISGFNITIIAGLFVASFGRLLGRRRGAVVAALGIAAYTLLAGADPAVVRAAVMGGLALLARQLGRRQHGLNSLAFVAAAMSLFNPHYPWDPGFQLSFMATLGLVLYADPFSQAFVALASRRLPLSAAQRLAGPVGEYVLFTLAAQLTTLPVMVYHFRRLSLVSLLANPAILPAQPPVMILGGLAALLGSLYLPLGQLAAPLAWPFVSYTIRIVEYFGRMPGGALLFGEVAVLWVILFYGALFGLTWGWSRWRGFILALRPAVPLAALGILTALVWRAGLGAPDGRLHLTLLAVSAGSTSGDAVLVQSPGGRYLLIDGGPSATLLADALGRRLPPFHRQLDYLVVAAPREEQLAALPRLVERYPPAGVLWAGPLDASRSARYLDAALTAARLPITPAASGQSLSLGDGAQLRLLSVGKRGAILLLEWGHFRALLPLGAELADLQALGLGREVGPVTALLLAENGAGPLNPPEWIASLHPQLVLLSVAAGDRDGLPSPETLSSLHGYPLLRTDQHGWIEITTDGERMWVEVERR